MLVASVKRGLLVLVPLAAAAALAAAPASAQPDPYVTSGPVIGWGSTTVPEATTLSPAAPVYSGTSPITVAYQWERKEDGVWVDLPGATALDYTVTHADLGLPLRVVATISNANATVTLASDTAGGPGSEPSFVTAPVLAGSTGGLPWQVGQSVTLTPATATSTNLPVTITYQWQRGHGAGYSDISGETGASYTFTSADLNQQVRVVAIAVDPAGSVTRSASNVAVAYPDPLTPVPTPVADPAPVVVSGDLTLTLAVDPSPTPSPAGFTLRVEAKNRDDAGAADAVVAVTLPTGVRLASQSFNRGSGCTAAGQFVTCSFGTLVGRTRAVARLALVPAGSGKLTLSATLSDTLGLASSVSAQLTVSIPSASSADASASRAAVPDADGVAITRHGRRVEAVAAGATSFRWQVLRGGRWSTVTGARGAILVPGPALAGLRVRAAVTLADGRRAFSNVLRLPR